MSRRIGSLLPIRRLMIASYIGMVFSSRIHIIAIAHPSALPDEQQLNCLYKAYRLLHDNSNLCIECNTMSGRTMHAAALEYGARIKADLIMTNPEEEVKPKNFLRKIGEVFLFPLPKISVMTVRML